MKQINDFAKSSFLYTIATAIGQGTTFVAMAVFTRIMSQSEYGEYSTYYAYVSLLTVIVGANLYYSINNAYIDHRERIYEYRKSVLVLSVLIMMVVFAGLSVVNAICGERVPQLLIIFGILHSYGFFLINYRMYSANMENAYKTKTLLLSIPYIIQFVLGAILVMYVPQAKFEARVIGSAMGIFICGLIVLVTMIGKHGPIINIADWKYALRISLPSIIMSLSYMIMQQCDKVMVNKYCGAEETAVYSVLYYLGYAIIAVDQSVSAVRQAWIYRKLDEQRFEYASKVQKWYLIVMAVLVTGVYMVAPEVIKIISPPCYWKFNYIVPLMQGACMMVLYKFYTEIAMFYKKNFQLSMCVLVSACINIILNALFIPIFGTVAACYTTVAAYLILFILSNLVVKNKVRRVYSGLIFVVFVIYIILISVLFEITKEMIIGRYGIFMVVLMCGMGCILKKRDEWKVLLVK